MKFLKSRHKKVNMDKKKRHIALELSCVAGVAGICLLLGMNANASGGISSLIRNRLSLSAEASTYTVSATVTPESYTDAKEENRVAGRGETTSSEADYGDVVNLTLKKDGADTKQALLLVSNEEAVSPALVRVSDASLITSLDNSADAVSKTSPFAYKTVTLSGRKYIYLISSWYSYDSRLLLINCDAATASVTNPVISVPDSILEDGYFRINVLPITITENILDTSNTVSTLRFSLYQRTYADKAAVTVSGKAVSDSTENAVGMSDTVKLAYPDDSLKGKVRYFYTVGSSTPYYVLRNNIPVAGNEETIQLSDAGDTINITPELADFGESFKINVVSVYYSSTGKLIHCVRTQNFRFKVNPQASIPDVSAYPVTSDQSPAEVRRGENIKLYVGSYTVGDSTSGNSLPVAGVDQSKYTIYYTLDGSEPSVTNDGVMQGTTMKYGSTGITVPKSDDSRLTVRAIATDGLWSYSSISSFVYKYPDSVSAPYATPTEGYVAENTQVALKCSTEGAKIYYTVGTDGAAPADPTTADTVYSDESPIIINKDTIIKAMASYNDIDSKVSSFTYHVSTKLSIPLASIASGSVVPNGTTLVLNSPESGTIHYTIDGSNPLDSANTNVAIGSIVPLNGAVGTTIMVKAYASKEEYSNSSMGVYVYTISNYAGGIYADKEDGSVLKNGEIVTLNTDVTDASIYYTIDGSTPTTASSSGSKVTVKGEPGSKIILKAIAVSSGSTRTTAAATFSYEIMGKLKAPKSSIPDGAVFTNESQIVLSAEQGSVYYTTNGEEPSTASNLYKEPITITKEMTINAIAVGEDMDNSDVSTFHYGFAEQVETPVCSHENGELELGTQVTFSCKTENVVMYYTTNGTDPNLKDKENLNVYNGPITVNKAVTIKLIATCENMQSSPIVTARYTVREPVVITTGDTQTNNYNQDNSGRLMSRRTYSGADSGPSHTDLIIRNINYGAVLSADAGIVPDGAQLVVEKVQVSQTTENMVKQMVNESYDVVSSYDVSLMVENEEVSPSGEVELGLPIPSEYENAIIEVVSVADDGMVQVFETRRSNGVAYADVSQMGVFSIIAPLDFESTESGFRFGIAAGVAGFVLVAGGLTLFLISRRKKKQTK